ncbi:MAG TPA: methylamine utilization protein [Kiritimatiellia bacterium]|nr:methylamine utilization protein [Kiritimatiellia bacterium]
MLRSSRAFRRAAAHGLAGALLCAPGTFAQETLIRVRDAAGAPVEYAVATWTSSSVAAAAEPGRAVIVQADQEFHPPVTLIPVGSTIAFPNEDTVAHHVYSFSPAKKFDLPLYTGESPQVVQFDKPGVVALGCNIHDWMTAYVFVTDTRWAALSDTNGVARLADIPREPGELRVWHPRLRGAPVSRTIQFDGAAPVDIELTLRPEVKRRGAPMPGGRGGYR